MLDRTLDTFGENWAHQAILEYTWVNLGLYLRIYIWASGMGAKQTVSTQTCATYMEGGELHWECRQLEGGRLNSQRETNDMGQ